MPIHLDRQLTEEDFAVLERDLTQMDGDDVAGILAFCEQISLEGATFHDECSGCVHQAENGSRAAELARAELDRRAEGTSPPAQKKEKIMIENKMRVELLGRARDHVDAHAPEFDPTDPGLFWGEALCEILGGADYLAFAKVTTAEDDVISAVPSFGEPVHPRQFTIEQLGTVVATAGEIHDAASSSPQGLITGTEAWVLSFAVQAGAAAGAGLAPLPGNPPGLAEALYATAFWLLNTPGGLLDLTGISRPW